MSFFHLAFSSRRFKRKDKDAVKELPIFFENSTYEYYARGHILRMCIYSLEARFIVCMPSFQFFHASAVFCVCLNL